MIICGLAIVLNIYMGYIWYSLFDKANDKQTAIVGLFLAMFCLLNILAILI